MKYVLLQVCCEQFNGIIVYGKRQSNYITVSHIYDLNLPMSLYTAEAADDIKLDFRHDGVCHHPGFVAIQ